MCEDPIKTKLNSQSRNGFISRIALALAAVGLVLVTTAAVNVAPAQAAVGINKTLNFQGRLLTATGAVVADGNYNMRFKIYQDGPGNVAGDTGGTLMWTELWQNSVASGSSAGVVVKNGYFSVNLGSYCAFAGGSCQGASNTGVDFNQDTLWLSMDVAGTAVSNAPTYDGELLPMRRLASSVYALQADNASKLGGLTSAQFLQTVPGSSSVNVIAPTANNTVALTVKGTTGTSANVLEVFDSTATPTRQAFFDATGALNVAKTIQPTVTNTTDIGLTGTQFRTGYFGTSVITPTLDTNSAVALNIGTTNASSIGLKKDTTVTGTLTVTPASDSLTTPQLRITSSSSSNAFTVATSSTLTQAGLALGSTNVPSITGNGLEIQGALRLSGALGTGNSAMDTFTTPIAGSVLAKLNIPIFDPAANGQAIAVGLTSTANSTSRGISVFDARTTTDNQPAIAVFSPNETYNGGFAWDNSNTAIKVKTNSTSTTSAAGITIQGGNVTGGSGLATGDVSVFTGTGSGTNTSSGSIYVDSGAKTGTGTAGSINIGAGNAPAINIGRTGSNATTTVNGLFVSKPTSGNDSATAFQLQNASGQTLFNLNTTTDSTNLITNGSFEANTTGWSAKAGATLSQASSPSLFGSKSLSAATTATAQDGVKYPVTLTAGVTYSFSFYARIASGNFTNMAFGYSADGTTEATYVDSNNTVNLSGWNRYSITFTPSAVSGSPYIFIKQATGTAHTIYVDGAYLVASGTAGVYAKSKLSFDGIITSPVILQSASDSQTGLLVQDNSGGSIFAVDTYNGRVGVGTTSPAAKLAVSTSGTTPGLKVLTTGSGNLIDLYNGSTSVGSISSTGAAVFANSSDSTAALQVQRSNAEAVLTVDTANNRVKVGDNTAGGYQTIAFVGEAVNNATAVTSLAVTRTTTAGNLLVMTVGTNSTSNGPTGVTDTAGNTWQLAGSISGTSGTGSRTDIYYAANAASITSATVNNSSAVDTTANLSEYSGAALTNVLDTAVTNVNSNTTTHTTTAAGTSINGELLVGNMSYIGNLTTTGPGGGWTSLTNSNDGTTKHLRTAYQISGTAGSYTATWTTSGATTSGAVLAAFKPAPTTSSTATLFVVDSATTSSAPGGTNGGMYYDTTLNKFRCFEGGVYVNCIGGGTATGAILQAPTSTADNTIAPTANSVVALTVKGTTGTSANVLEVFDSSATPTRQAFFDAAGALNVAKTIQPTVNNSVDLGLTGTQFRTGYFGTSLLTPSLDTNSGVALNIGATNATAINIGKTGSNIPTTITGTSVFKPSTGNESATAFQVQNASGVKLLNINTTVDSTNLITNGNFETNTAGWSAKGGATIATSSAQATFGDKSLSVTTTAAADDGVKYPVTLTAGTTYTVTFYTRLDSGSFSTMAFGYSSDGTTETTYVSSGNAPALDGWQRFKTTFTPSAVSGSPYIFIKQTSSTARTFYIDGVYLGASAFDGMYRESAMTLNGTITSPLIVQPSSDTQSAILVLDASGDPVFSVDTRSKRIGFGTGTPGAKLHVTSSSSTTTLIKGNVTSTADLLNLTKNDSRLVTVKHTGETIFKQYTGSDSATAFQIQNAAGTNIFNVDTVSSLVQVAGTLDTTTSTALNIGTSNATSIALKKNTAVTGTLTVSGANGDMILSSATDGGTFNIGTSASGTLAVYGVSGNTLDLNLLDGNLQVGSTTVLTNGRALQNVTSVTASNASQTTGSTLSVTSTNNAAANTSWSANKLSVTNAQGTAAVTGMIAGLDVQFTQNTSIAGNTETVANFQVAANASSSTDATIASILNLSNNDTATGNQITVTDAIKITGGSNITNGINLSGTFSGNLISSTNFNVTNAGQLTAGGSILTSVLDRATAGALTIGASTATSIQVGSATNNMTFASTGEPTLNGTAQHTRQITLSAEYAGASMTGDGTSNNGQMISDNMTSSPFRNYYEWSTTQGTAQDYDIWVRVPLPSDFSSLPSGQTICIDTYASATTANGVKLNALYGTNNSAVTVTTTDLTPTSANTWQNKCTSSITGGTYAANGVMTLDLKLTAPATTGIIRVGDITFNYLSKW